jgi:hypothetical protein
MALTVTPPPTSCSSAFSWPEADTEAEDRLQPRCPPHRRQRLALLRRHAPPELVARPSGDDAVEVRHRLNNLVRPRPSAQTAREGMNRFCQIQSVSSQEACHG